MRWKPLNEQAIGWEPDINDGVRMNIRPFITARTAPSPRALTPPSPRPSPGGRGGKGCILRVTPKIKWDKDRGKEPERPKQDFPWFWAWDEATPDFAGGASFDGNRWNALHYTPKAKRAARERAAKGRAL